MSPALVHFNPSTLKVSYNETTDRVQVSDYAACGYCKMTPRSLLVTLANFTDPTNCIDCTGIQPEQSAVVSGVAAAIVGEWIIPQVSDSYPCIYRATFDGSFGSMVWYYTNDCTGSVAHTCDFNKLWFEITLGPVSLTAHIYVQHYPYTFHKQAIVGDAQSFSYDADSDCGIVQQTAVAGSIGCDNPSFEKFILENGKIQCEPLFE